MASRRHQQNKRISIMTKENNNNKNNDDTNTKNITNNNNESTKQVKQKKMVTFNPKVQVRIERKPKYITEEEKQCIWYTKHDYENIQIEMNITLCIITLLQHNGGLEDKLYYLQQDDTNQECITIKDNTLCFRGLEHITGTPFGPLPNALRRKLSIMAVLYEQRRRKKRRRKHYNHHEQQQQSQQHHNNDDDEMKPKDLRIAQTYSKCTDEAIAEAYKRGLQDQTIFINIMKSDPNYLSMFRQLNSSPTAAVDDDDDDDDESTTSTTTTTTASTTTTPSLSRSISRNNNNRDGSSSNSINNSNSGASISSGSSAAATTSSRSSSRTTESNKIKPTVLINIESSKREDQRQHNTICDGGIKTKETISIQKVPTHVFIPDTNYTNKKDKE